MEIRMVLVIAKWGNQEMNLTECTYKYPLLKHLRDAQN